MRYECEPYDLCPCGSGKKYKFCCAAANKGKGHGKYPVGTVAFYGPDDKTVTKMAAGVLLREDAEPIMERWVSTNIMQDEKIGQAVRRFFASHGVKTVVSADGVLGCPHEEGEDFPVGADCPLCPFWAGKQGSPRRDEPDDAGVEIVEPDEEEDDEDEDEVPGNKDIREQHAHSMAAIESGIADMDAIVGPGEISRQGAIERLRGHLVASLRLPCEVTGSEDFQWEEGYVITGLLAQEYARLKKTQPSYRDRYELLEVMPDAPSPWKLCDADLVARARRISDGRVFLLGLSELEAVDRTTPEAELLRAYSAWFGNAW